MSEWKEMAKESPRRSGNYLCWDGIQHRVCYARLEQRVDDNVMRWTAGGRRVVGVTHWQKLPLPPPPSKE